MPVASEAEHRAEILRLLRDSIRKRMMSDVPFGVFLSGGVDSSANVALMSELMTRPVETFTVGFSDAEYLNELDSARRIARQFATNHHEVIISEKEMQDFLPSLVFHQDEPIADPVCVPLYYVSKLARDSGNDRGPGRRRLRRDLQRLRKLRPSLADLRKLLASRGTAAARTAARVVDFSRPAWKRLARNARRSS